MNRIYPLNLFKTSFRLRSIPLQLGFVCLVCNVSASGYPMCMSFIDTTYVETTIENCDNTATICIESAIADMLSYDITDNGLTYTGVLSPCDFDTAYAYTYNSIPDGGAGGPYQVDSWIVNGTSYGGFVLDMADLRDSMNIWDTTGSWNLDSFTSTIRGGLPGNIYGNIEITQISTGNTSIINLNTTLNPKGASMTVDTGFHQLIFLDPADGCMDTIDVLVNCTPCGEIYSGPKTFEVPSCIDQQLVCVDLPETKLSEYTISDNGSNYTGLLQACRTDSFFVYDYSSIPGGGMAGPYQLQNWSVNGSVFLGGFADINALVDSMNVWDLMGNWILDESQQTISGGGAQSTYGVIQMLQIISGASGSTSPQQMESVTSVQMTLDTGLHEIVFLNTTNQCEASFDFEINCSPCPIYFNDSPILAIAEHCDSATDVCIPIAFSDWIDWSLFVDQSTYSGVLDVCGSDSQITLDTGTYELIVLNSSTMCSDTTLLTINCTPVICTDFIAEENFTALAYSCDSIGEYCTSLPFNDQSDYEIFDNGVGYNGLGSDCGENLSLILETGSHQLIFLHTPTGCLDTITGTVSCLQSKTLDLSITAGAIDTICLDTIVLPGNIVTIANFCEGDAGELVIFTLDNMTNCLIYEGVEEGLESACIEFCDDQGFCDTTFINVMVDPFLIEPSPDTLPLARDDYALTVEDIDITIEVLGNDTINGILDTMGIVTNPIHGLVLIVDGEIVYLPEEGFCSNVELDTFDYFICNTMACDTATVSVEVACEALEVHNGFSPNGDGINDFFVIRGIEAYPNSSLKVFNRWGNQIFSASGYQNDWNGSWEGIDLPNGTYFYYFENGEGSKATGYVLLQR